MFVLSLFNYPIVDPNLFSSTHPYNPEPQVSLYQHQPLGLKGAPYVFLNLT